MGSAGEPTVRRYLDAGADVVTFSGDKLLGGPQAGLIAGRRRFVEPMKRHPLLRALRMDKLNLAALEATLRLYRDERQALAAIPTLRMLTENETAIQPRAEELARRLRTVGDSRLKVEIMRLSSKAGGGSLPLLDLPSRCLRVQIERVTANQLELKLRRNDPPIIGRIEDGAFLMDARTLQPDEAPIIAAALASALAGG